MDRGISYIECILRYCKIIENIQDKNNKDYGEFLKNPESGGRFPLFLS